MAGYIGSKASVTQVDGYNRSEADAEFVNDPNDVITVSGSNVGIGASSFPVNGKNLKIEDATISRLVLANTGDSTFEFGSIAGGSLNVYDATADAERMRIDSAGRVTMPYQPAFCAYLTAGGVSTGTLVYTSTLVNQGGHYNTSTGLFTAPVAGTYLFHSTTFGNTAASTISYFYTQFIKNGLATGPITHSQYNDTRNYETITDAQILMLAANDTVSVYYSSGSAPEYGGPYSHFSGHLIG